jgi:hypothetical protein
MRSFNDQPATRSHVPLLIGLMGPSGGGKTYSALRLGSGIAAVAGGDCYVIDTEARRALHYADHFKFRHIDLAAPFGSLDYLAAARHCVQKGASVVIIDSMSHEHDGEGGYLRTQEAELTRLAGDDFAKRERVKMLSWARPAALRQQMISGLLQLNANFIFCFRAKEKTKPVKIGGKTEIQEMGWMPIAGEALMYEMTVNCLLLPRANGVPTWESEYSGEKQMMKLPVQFKELLSSGRPLDETMGKALAEWARGGIGQTIATAKLIDRTPEQFPVPPEFHEAHTMVMSAAKLGRGPFEAAWRRLSKDEKDALKGAAQAIYKPLVEAANA